MRAPADTSKYVDLRLNLNELNLGNRKPDANEHLLAQEHLTLSSANVVAENVPACDPPTSSSSPPSPSRKRKVRATAADLEPSDYTEPFVNFISENPTVFHTVHHFQKRLDEAGFKRLYERDGWKDTIKAGGRYYVSRNECSMVAFVVGKEYQPGNGFAIIAGHIDALCLKLKPVSSKPNSQGYVSLGVAPYAGALNNTWWDRDLSIGGRVIVKNPRTGKIQSRLVKIGWPIAKIPTLAPHFGNVNTSNKETQMFPIIGLEGAARKTTESPDPSSDNFKAAPAGSFATKQPPRLVELIASQLGVRELGTILNWELELFDSQPASLIGMDKELLSAPRIDDKINSWAAMEALIHSADVASKGGVVTVTAVFDEEEIGSRLRDGAASNLLPGVVARISEAVGGTGPNMLQQAYARSYLLSADVTHAVAPQYVPQFLPEHMPRPNVGITVVGDSNGHMTTDSISHAVLTEVAERSGCQLQVFQIRNDSRSGGTIGPMLSTAMGVRAIDAGVPELSMHSIRSTVGSLDPGLAVKLFSGFFEHYEHVDSAFED